MTDKVKKVIEEIESGTRDDIYDVDFTLEEYLSKNIDGISFLEYLLKKDIYIYEKKVFANSIEATLIYLKMGESLWGFDLEEEKLFTKIEGKNLIELIIDKNSFTANSLIKNIKENIKIIDILIENDKEYYLSYLSPEIIDKLMTLSSDGTYPIEKYFDNKMAIQQLIPLIKTPKELIELCKKHNAYSLLNQASVEVLMYKLDNDKSILEDLCDKNEIPHNLKNIPENLDFIKFLIEKEFYNYLENASESVLLLKIETEKSLLDELIEKNKIKKITAKIWEKDTIKKLYSRNMLGIISNVSDNLLLKPFNEIINDTTKSNELFLEYMLKQGYNPLSESNYMSNEEVIKIYCEKGYYKFLGEKRLSDKNLLLELEDGITIIDKLLENNINIEFESSKFNSDIIAKKLFEKKRFDLLVKGNPNLLFNLADSEKSYLEHILESIKTKKIKYDLNKLTRYQKNNTKARLYILIAKYDMLEYVEELSESDLLEEENGKTLLEELLELDQDLTVNKIIPPRVKSNMKIAINLKSKGIEQNKIDLPLENPNFDKEYLKGIETKYGIGPLLSEGESLLNEVYQLFMNDGKSDPELISSLISGYRQSLFENYELNIQELRNLVEVKSKNPDKFIYLKTEKGAFFSPSKGAVYCQKNVISTMLHETGHALHHYLIDSRTPEEYKDIIENARNNPETMKKVEKFASEYDLLKTKIKELAEKKYQQFFENYINSEKKQEICEFIKKSKNDKKEEFKSLGLPEETLDIILNSIFTSEEYFEQQKRIIINQYADDIIRSEFEVLGAIGDILDAIYEGELHSGVLQNETGEKIKRTAGHGISYYSNPYHGFDEMIANFATIIKLPNSEENLNTLKDMIGEEVFKMLREFYYNNITRSNVKELEQGRSL